MTAEADLLAQWERCVGEGPHRPALIIDGGPVLTYRELDRRTDALAADLVARGAGPERIVGLALASPASTVAGMVAVLKSGAAFTVLDGALPRSARAAIAAGANADPGGAAIPGRATLRSRLAAGAAPPRQGPVAALLRIGQSADPVAAHQLRGSAASRRMGQVDRQPAGPPGGGDQRCGRGLRRAVAGVRRPAQAAPRGGAERPGRG